MNNLRKQYKEALSYHQLFRELEFAPKDIYVDIKYSKLYVFVNGNGKLHGFSCGKFDLGIERLRKEWPEAVNIWCDVLTDQEIKKIYVNSSAFHNKVYIVKELIKSGVF